MLKRKIEQKYALRHLTPDSQAYFKRASRTLFAQLMVLKERNDALRCEADPGSETYFRGFFDGVRSR